MAFDNLATRDRCRTLLRDALTELDALDESLAACHASMALDILLAQRPATGRDSLHGDGSESA